MPWQSSRAQRTKSVALVTGGSSGIGLAIARKFAHAGYRILLCGRDLKKGERVARGMRGSGYEATFLKADVASEDEVRNLMEEGVRPFGRLDVLCNNAGMQRLSPLEALSTEEWDELMAIHARGPFLCTKYAVPYLKKTKGSIINIASTGGLVGYAEGSAYCTSKAALVMLTKVLALELAPYRIRVNCVCPGATQTPMIPRKARKVIAEKVPLGRVGRPEEVADLVFFLASESARQITGGVLVMDGGITAGRLRLAQGGRTVSL